MTKEFINKEYMICEHPHNFCTENCGHFLIHQKISECKAICGQESCPCSVATDAVIVMARMTEK